MKNALFPNLLTSEDKGVGPATAQRHPRWTKSSGTALQNLKFQNFTVISVVPAAQNSFKILVQQAMVFPESLNRRRATELHNRTSHL
jgi:hypothetical protein